MCGIIGYIGTKKANNILIDGLLALEYRGYDSAGIATLEENSIKILKNKGRVNNLLSLDGFNNLTGTYGIAHTRWATHGGPNEVNAHPHTCGKITLVHNGIIENAHELRDRLIESGVKFVSETDTEVACALINSYYEGDVIKAINKACKDIIGSYAFAIVVDGDDKIYGIRKDSPLILGIGEDDLFLASDIAAIIDYTDKYVLLDEREIVEISKDGYAITKNGKSVDKEVLTAVVSSEARDKCGYEHFMLKEIMEEPVVLKKTLDPYIEDLDKLIDLSEYEEIHIVACGSAYYAGMIGKSLLEEKAGIRVVCDVASEYRYKKVLYDRKTLVILISQSGETADTIAAMRKANEEKVDTLAIVNVKGSTIARESKIQVFIEAGPEIAVATTKAYILQVAIISLMAYKAAIKKGLEKDKDILNDFDILPRMLKEVLDRREEYLNIANEIYNNEDIFFIGRKVDYSISMEGSLKLKEVSYIHSEAYQAGELKHGTISLIEDEMPVFGIITDKDIREKTISNIEEVKSRGAKIIIVTNEKIGKYELEIVVPKVSDYCQGVLIVPVLQLIAYEVAKIRGCDIDKPKNLAKSVTVE